MQTGDGRVLPNPLADVLVPDKLPSSLVDYRPLVSTPLSPIENKATPKRSRSEPEDVDMGTGGPKRTAMAITDFGVGPDRANPRFDLSLIVANPLRGYPPDQILYGMPTNSELLQLDIFERRFHSDTGVFTRGQDDPATLMLQAVGARPVPVGDIEMCTFLLPQECLAIFKPFENTTDLFEAYALPERRAAVGLDLHGWTFGTRLGQEATGKWSNSVQAPTDCQPRGPPAFRKANWRELKAYLQASKQLGMPCTAAADSQLGWNVYALQSPEVLVAHCEGSQSLLLRLEGDACKGYQATKKDLAQKAKCGYCPCCAKVTHVLIPPTYPLGVDCPKKARAVRLWQQSGPMATRNYAAAAYQNNYGTVSSNWDWAARSRNIGLPAPLDMAARKMIRDDSQESRWDDDSSGFGRPPKGFPSPSPCPSAIPPLRPRDAASPSPMGPSPINPYANVKPPHPARPDLLEQSYSRPPPTQIASKLAENDDAERSQVSRGSHTQEDFGRKGSGKRERSGGRHGRSDWADGKSSKSEWRDHKTSWSDRGWSATRRYREEGRRK